MPVAHADTLVGCDTAGLVTAITSANSSGGGTLDLTAGCTYLLESGSYGDGNGNGPDGLPVITTAITIHGNGAIITADPLTPGFRLLEVSNGGDFTADHVALNHGDVGTSGAGGDLYNLGIVTLTNSTISNGNAAAGGGIASESGTSLTLTSDSISDNTSQALGGGIERAGTAKLTDDTISGNAASDGGGLYGSGGSVTITNSTISANNSETAGIFNGSTSMTLTNDTVSNNAGLGLFDSVATMTLASSILSNNVGGNCSGANAPRVDDGYNLDSDGTCLFTASTDIKNVSPQLGPLQANGGPTATMALAKTSPAVDVIPSGTNGCATTITTDQQGVPRPQVGSGCDIGAYEYGDLGMQALTASPNPVKHKSNLTYRATVENAGAADATGVTVTDTLPKGETYKSATASQGSCSVASSKVTCTLGEVGAATAPTVTIVVKVTAAKGKTLNNSTSVSATTGDTNPGNASQNVSVTVS
jgi:uncharacterized repeat protein (TIGR01451 family)